MPQFEYEARDSQGKKTRGTVSAADERAVAIVLRRQALFLVRIIKSGAAPTNSTGIFKGLFTKRPQVSSQNLIFFYKQMDFMLRSGLTVLQGLQLSKSLVGGAFQDVVARMETDIQGGQRLSQAMAQHPTIFPQLSVNLVVAGESTGTLNVVFERLATFLERRLALRKQIISALTYPAIVMVATVVVVAFLLIKIIPTFARYITGKGNVLPASTQMMIDISAFVTAYGIYVLAAIAIVLLSIVSYYKTSSGRKTIDGLMLRLPVLGNLMTVSAMTQMNWALAMLINSGLTVVDALKITSGMIGNRVVAEKVNAAPALVLAGKDLAGSLRHPVIPNLVIQMIVVGERTGSLGHVLQELGRYYEEALQHGIKRMTTLLEPMLLAVIASSVGFVYFSFFQAMFQLSKR
jgi:type IV pilus assembly protein PilC